MLIILVFIGLKGPVVVKIILISVGVVEKS